MLAKKHEAKFGSAHWSQAVLMRNEFEYRMYN